MSHTPTPWARDRRTVYALCEDKYNNRFTALVQGGWTVAPTKGRTTDQELEANAAFIVRAVNCHDELVEALEQAAKQLEWAANDTGVNGTTREGCMNKADEFRSIAAKARGETP